jgi:hypothetical protein
MLGQMTKPVMMSWMVQPDKGEGTSGSLHKQPPSKHPRLSQQPAVPDKRSPATNNGDRRKYLYSLCIHPSYKTLVDGMLALPLSVSPFFFIHVYGFV